MSIKNIFTAIVGLLIFLNAASISLAQEIPQPPSQNFPFIISSDIMGQGYTSENCEALSVRLPGYCFGFTKDLEKIKRAYNTINVVSSINAYWDRWLIPVIKRAWENNLAVIVNSSTTIENAEQGFSDLAAKVKDYPNVIAFKVQDELGGAKTVEFWLDYLRKAKQGIRKHSQALIVFDIIPCEYVYPGWAECTDGDEYLDAMNLAAIDRYVNSGYVDGLILSFGDKLSSGLPQATQRWGNKVRIFVRNGSAIPDTIPFPSEEKEKSRLYDRQFFIRSAGVIGTSDYTWRHKTGDKEYILLNKDGSETPTYKTLVKTFQDLGSPRFNFSLPPTPTLTPTLTPTPTPLPAVRPQINIPDKKTIYLNGKPFIPRGIWNPFVIKLDELANREVIKRRLVELGDRGFNMFLEKINCKSAETACKDILNEVTAYNEGKTDPNEHIWVFFSLQNVLSNNKNDTAKAVLEAREVVGKVYGYKYFLGMLLFDEPDYSSGVPANFLTVVNNELHETYPLFLSFIDLGKPESSRLYLNSADILAHEYHFYLTDSSHAPTYESYITTIKSRAEQFVNGTKDASGNYQKPVWAAVHTVGNYVDDKGILQMKEPPTSLQHLSTLQKWLEGGMTGFFAYSYQHTNWILPNNSPSSWPDTTSDFGSPPLWNGFLSNNEYAKNYIYNRDIANNLCSEKSQGDANCDGEIDGIDYSIWLRTQCRPSGNIRCANNQADYNKDGNIDDDDYRVWFGGRE